MVRTFCSCWQYNRYSPVFKVEMLSKKAFSFVFERDKTIQIVFGLFALIIGIFLPPIIFLMVGLFGGRAMNQMAMQASSKQ